MNSLRTRILWYLKRYKHFFSQSSKRHSHPCALGLRTRHGSQVLTGVFHGNSPNPPQWLIQLYKVCTCWSIEFVTIGTILNLHTQCTYRLCVVVTEKQVEEQELQQFLQGFLHSNRISHLLLYLHFGYQSLDLDTTVLLVVPQNPPIQLSLIGTACLKNGNLHVAL